MLWTWRRGIRLRGGPGYCILMACMRAFINDDETMLRSASTRLSIHRDVLQAPRGCTLTSVGAQDQEMWVSWLVTAVLQSILNVVLDIYGA